MNQIHPRRSERTSGIRNRSGDSFIPVNADDENRRASDLNFDGARNKDLARFDNRQERVDIL
jgi:hypothetical protein